MTGPMRGQIQSGRLAGKTLRQAIWIVAVPVLIQQTLGAFVGLVDKMLAGGLPKDIVVASLDGLGIGSYVGWLIAIAMGVRMLAYCTRTMNAASLQIQFELDEAAYVSGVSHREDKGIRSFSECFTYFEGERFLAFQAEGIDGIEQVSIGLLNEPHGIVKIPIDLDDLCPVYDSLGYFSHRHITRGDQDDGPHTGTPRVGGERSRGISGGSAGDGGGPQFFYPSDSDRHSPIFERSGRILSLMFHVEGKGRKIFA